MTQTKIPTLYAEPFKPDELGGQQAWKYLVEGPHPELPPDGTQIRAAYVVGNMRQALKMGAVQRHHDLEIEPEERVFTLENA